MAVKEEEAAGAASSGGDSTGGSNAVPVPPAPAAGAAASADQEDAGAKQGEKRSSSDAEKSDSEHAADGAQQRKRQRETKSVGEDPQEENFAERFYEVVFESHRLQLTVVAGRGPSALSIIAANRSGKPTPAVGDLIYSVNGTSVRSYDVDGKPHLNTTKLLKASPRPLTIGFLRARSGDDNTPRDGGKARSGYCVML